jgi:hypothetical protein
MQTKKLATEPKALLRNCIDAVVFELGNTILGLRSLRGTCGYSRGDQRRKHSRELLRNMEDVCGRKLSNLRQGSYWQLIANSPSMFAKVKADDQLSRRS